MKNEDDDIDLLKAWRGAAFDVPDHLMDARVLRAHRLQRLRIRLLPIAFGLAACLIMAVALTNLRKPLPQASNSLDTSNFGLEEGRSLVLLSNPIAMQEMLIQHQAQSAKLTEVVYP